MYFAFLDLEKAYDRVGKRCNVGCFEIIWN